MARLDQAELKSAQVLWIAEGLLHCKACVQGHEVAQASFEMTGGEAKREQAVLEQVVQDMAFDVVNGSRARNREEKSWPFLLEYALVESSALLHVGGIEQLKSVEVGSFCDAFVGRLLRLCNGF